MSCLCWVSSLLSCEAERGMSGSAADPVSFMWADQTLCHKQSWDQFQMKRILTVYVLLLYFLIKNKQNKKNWLENRLQLIKGFMPLIWFYKSCFNLYELENNSLISHGIYILLILIKTHSINLILHIYLTIKCLQNAPSCFQIWEFPLLFLSDDLGSWLSISGQSRSRFMSRVRLLRSCSSLIHVYFDTY